MLPSSLLRFVNIQGVVKDTSFVEPSAMPMDQNLENITGRRMLIGYGFGPSAHTTFKPRSQVRCGLFLSRAKY